LASELREQDLWHLKGWSSNWWARRHCSQFKQGQVDLARGSSSLRLGTAFLSRDSSSW